MAFLNLVKRDLWYITAVIILVGVVLALLFNMGNLVADCRSAFEERLETCSLAGYDRFNYSLLPLDSSPLDSDNS